MKNLSLVFLATVMTLSVACTKEADNNVEPEMGGQSELSTLPVAMYSVENSYKTKSNKCEIDESSILIKNEILSNSDILSYSEKEMSFTVTQEGFKKVKDLQDAQPFVLAVAGDISLVGMFKPFHSPSICEGSVLMNYGENNKIYFFAGNPTLLSESDVVSKVNNKMLLTALRQSGRLK